MQVAARAEHDVLTEASAHLIQAGGKRLRPMLVLLAAQFGNPHDKRVVPAAVAVELTHLATLYHDDVMDEADVRRGTPSANSRWNNTIAILTGDFLFARASQLLADLGSEAIRIQAETFSRLVTGQVAETVGPAPGADPFEHYLGVISEKTGSLIATAGRFGAMFSDAPAGVADPDGDRLRGAGGGVPALRRHPGRVQRPGPVRQDARHRPARGHQDAADAARPEDATALGRLRDARLIELLSQEKITDPAQHSEALGLLREHPAMELARQTSAAGPRWPGTRSAACPRFRLVTHSRPSASSLSSAAGRQVVTRGRGGPRDGGIGIGAVFGANWSCSASAERCWG